MQIDTRVRSCGVTPADVDKCTSFTPGMEARQARYGRKVAVSNYSGVLECPCNSRYGGDPIFYPEAKTKVVVEQYAVLNSGACAAGRDIQTAAGCWSAAVALGLEPRHLTNATIADPAKPPGCTVVASAAGGAAVTFNSAGKAAACPKGTLRAGSTTSGVGVTLQVVLRGGWELGLGCIGGWGVAEAGVHMG